MLQDLSPAMAKALQLDDQSGVLVCDVVDDGPAEKAGLQDGDVIIAFAGKSLADNAALTKAVRAAKPGDKVDVTVLRDGKKQTIKVELGERENDFAWFTPGSDEHVKVIMKGLHGGDGDFEFHTLHEDRGWLGVQIDDVSPQLGEYFGVKDGEGVLVTEVERGQPRRQGGPEGRRRDRARGHHRRRGHRRPARRPWPTPRPRTRSTSSTCARARTRAPT